MPALNGTRDGHNLLCSTCQKKQTQTRVVCPGIGGECKYDLTILTTKPKQLRHLCVRVSKGGA